MSVIYLEDSDLSMMGNKLIIKTKGTPAANKIILVMVYADWCPHCQQAKPEFMKLASDVYKSKGSHSILALLDTQFSPHAAGLIAQVTGQKGIPNFPLFAPMGSDKAEFIGTHTGGRNASGYLNSLDNEVKAMMNRDNKQK
jgi:thiol-disulfide isomerase/thioredoxin